MDVTSTVILHKSISLTPHLKLIRDDTIFNGSWINNKMPNFIKLIDSVYDSIYTKKPLISAKKQDDYILSPSLVKSLNQMFFSQYPIAKFLPVNKVKKLFQNFMLDTLDNFKYLGGYPKYHPTLPSLVLAVFHHDNPVKCSVCKQSIQKEYINIESTSHRLGKNMKWCVFCLHSYNVGKCWLCNRYFGLLPRGNSPKAYPVLNINTPNGSSGLGEFCDWTGISIKQLENLGTVDIGNNSTRIYLDIEALDSPELIDLLKGNTKLLKIWKQIFNKDICYPCLRKISDYSNKNVFISPLFLYDERSISIIGKLPYTLERVDSANRELANRRVEVIEMLKGEITDDITPLYSLLNISISNKELSSTSVTNTVANALVDRIAKNKDSENIIKEITGTRKNHDILVLIPLDEAKETDQDVIEEIANRILSAVASKVTSIKHSVDIEVVEEAISIRVNITV